MTPNDFIAEIAPPARASAAHTCIPASFTIAEAALESGWGASKLAEQGMNLFGVKAGPEWHGDVLTMNTREFLNGAWVMVPATWRKYTDWLGSITDHASFLLTNERYKTCFLGNPSGTVFAQRVAAAGYATDPAYAQKIGEIIAAHSLSQFD